MNEYTRMRMDEMRRAVAATCCTGMSQVAYDMVEDQFVISCPSCGRRVSGKDMSDVLKAWEDLLPERLSVEYGRSFGDVLIALEKGLYAARNGWNGKDMWIHLQKPDEHSKMNRPYIYMKAVNDELVPWVASQTDLLAKDWIVWRRKE